MKSRYMPILYVGMVLAAFAAGFHALDRLSRSLPRNPSKTRTASALPAEMPQAALSETTLSDIRKSLEKQEYHISFDEQKKKLQSPNRSNNIRAYYEPGKLTVQTRANTTGQGFKFEMVNEGVFADGKLLYIPQASAKAQHHENKVQITHSAFTEEFINNEDGVRQNFIIESAPEGTRQLQVKMSVNGLRVAQGSGNELRFYSKTPDGGTRNELVYSDLKCWDANKRPLNATLAYVDNRIQISVDVAGAAYPVTIDPIIANGTPQNANKVLEINQSYMWLGFSVSSAGDVNGDGYSDIIVGAPQYDLGQDNEGAAFIYPGSASGILAGAVILQCDQAGAKMGYSVSTAGDFNGDGYSDVLVGIPYYDLGGGKDNGLARLYYGSAQGIPANSVPLTFPTAESGGCYGISVASAGDIDADGFSDVIIGAHLADLNQNGEKSGFVAVYYGAPINGKMEQYLHPDVAGAMFGYSVAGAGDVDADGFGDVIVGARYYTNGQGQDAEGAAFVYRGSANGLDKNNPVIIEGNQYNAAMGNKVSSAGDLNGDGYSDILISAYLKDGLFTDEGQVQLHYGSPTGIDPQKYDIFSGGHQNDHMGSSISCAGDVNGDGYADILVGAEYYDNGQFNEGAIFVHHGSKYGKVDKPASILESNQANGWFGTAVSSAGDVNGDGYSDILVGCYTFDNGQTDEGHVFVYHGGAEGIGTKDAVTLSGSVSGAMMGYSVASAGDVNSDGFDDVILGAPEFDFNGTTGGVAIVYYGSVNGIVLGNQTMLSKNQAGANFGISVNGAGDVNGDGYDDVVVGANAYDNGQSGEGIAVVYYGSNSGVSQASSKTLENNTADSMFGYTVSGAGDINRDGYADLIVGAPGISAGQATFGAVYVYSGSSSGPASPVTIPGTEPDANFGSSVSSGGDINGDGYADIIAGADDSSMGQAEEGAAYVFYGSSAGIEVGGKVLQSNQVGARFGASVSAAGDVNGDGYGDIIIGSPVNNNKGAALVYYGASAGINELNPGILASNSGFSRMGCSVKSAGDVNGDGYADVVVGASIFENGQANEGKVFVFHGSPTGIKPTASFNFEGDQDNAKLGFSVSGAGDVNGDGYSDIIVGAPHANYNQTNDVGAATVLYGNNGQGLKNNVRLFNGDLVTPLNHNQFSLSNFVATLSAKSFIGKNKGKFVWETMGPGVPFSKVGSNPITTSNLFTGSSTFTALTGISTTLGGSIAKTPVATKLRVRVRYSPVLAITGQMYGPWRYLQSQLAGYNNAPVPEDTVAETIKRKAEPEIETSVSVFPNPASDRLSVQVADPSDIRGARLYNTSGTVVFQSKRYEEDIDVSKLPGGVYVLMLNRANGTATSHRILIRR
ncbi:MAG: FG-GAP repeat protein [Dyadobacter sp.]|uniref:FG-GAP-like repeat-containing protein n=1 Tax=Dyadobacter sp. TaxID=1914288 RepID=UPI001B1BCC0D|nr:FG-GAP-like repeat-containing protein [Dyadobacter sp.]MBO9616708.1 FG-GAP repeat protein [Dyadobacter sp.]